MIFDDLQKWEVYKRRRNLILFLLIGYVPITFAFGLLVFRIFHVSWPVLPFTISWMSLGLYAAAHKRITCPRCGKWFCFDRD